MIMVNSTDQRSVYLFFWLLVRQHINTHKLNKSREYFSGNVPIILLIIHVKYGQLLLNGLCLKKRLSVACECWKDCHYNTQLDVWLRTDMGCNLLKHPHLLFNVTYCHTLEAFTELGTLFNVSKCVQDSSLIGLCSPTYLN